MKYSSTNDKSVNRIDIIDEICEEYVPDIRISSDELSGNPHRLIMKIVIREDIYVLEQLFKNDDPFQTPPMDLKQSEVTEAKSSIEEPPELGVKTTISLRISFLEETIVTHIIAKDDLKTSGARVKDGNLKKFMKSIKRRSKISNVQIEVDRAKVDVIAKLPHPTTVKELEVF
ncbi:hypothetical protein Tco_0705711 [Tanacetum coccineum]|uniref:Uncharacterized protein n=1 Tax=Tanacetum coccineum TaxID=301880 RepID=A0ABQ4Y5D5_9ASTR